MKRRISYSSYSTISDVSSSARSCWWIFARSFDNSSRVPAHHPWSLFHIIRYGCEESWHYFFKSTLVHSLSSAFSERLLPGHWHMELIPRTALVDDIIQDLQRICEANEPGTIRIWLDIPVRVAPLFELRLKARDFNRISEIRRRVDEDRGIHGYMNVSRLWNDKCGCPSSRISISSRSTANKIPPGCRFIACTLTVQSHATYLQENGRAWRNRWARGLEK